MLELSSDLSDQPTTDRQQEHEPEILHHVIAHRHQQQRRRRQLQFELVEHFLKRRNDEEHNTGQNPDRDNHDRDRINQCPLHLALERLGTFQELCQPLKNRFQRTTGLTRLDHVDIESTKHLRILRHRFRQGLPGLNVLAYILQRKLQTTGLLVVL